MDAAPDEVVDIEEYFKAGKPVPAARKYRFRVGKTVVTVETPLILGREILTLAGKTPPESFVLQQITRDGVKPVGLDETVDLRAPGIERFSAIPKEVTDGEGKTFRRDFQLLNADQVYLERRGLAWETVTMAGIRRVVMHSYPIPNGYNCELASVNVRLEAGYPETQIDMAYFDPPLARSDGKAIPNLSSDPFDEKSWQGWSRHRTAKSAWRIGEDSLETHMALVDSWLRDELKR